MKKQNKNVYFAGPPKKTALVLSGGGSRGAYQCGAWQALDELGVKLDIVTGVSVGALNGVMVVQGDQIETANLWRKLETDMVFDVESDAQMQDFAVEFLKNGGAGTEGLQSIIREYIDEDELRKSPIDYGLLTVEFPAMKPHYKWLQDIPEGQLADYVTASASAFPALHPHEIDGKSYIDGGYENNLPVKMAVDRGATHIIAVYLKAIGKFDPKELDTAENILFVEPKWDLGSFLIFDKKNTKRTMRLGYLDMMKALDVYDGDYYSFVKGEFDKKTVLMADACAKIFELNPLILYKKEIFMEEISRSIEEAREDISDKLDFRWRGPFKLEKIKDALETANKKTLVLVLAQFIADGDDDASRILKSKSVQRLLKNELAAAKFIYRYSL